MKPGPAISTSRHTPASTPVSTTRCAISRGFDPICFASGSAPFTCASARSLGRTTGSAGPPAISANTGASSSETMESGSATSPIVADRPTNAVTSCAVPNVSAGTTVRFDTFGTTRPVPR